MPCYKPMTAYRMLTGRSSSGGWPITFDKSKGYQDLKVTVACGQCIGCRIDKARIWAMRLEHENKMHDFSCFLTLTYDEEYLPEGNTLVKRDVQLFMKKLRKKTKKKLKYYLSGEYGENLDRPHYHIILFGYDFPDRKYFKSIQGNRYYTSDELAEVWDKGHHLIGSVTFDSCAYVASYVTKKITGEMAKTHYGDRLPEFSCISNRPGIGLSWLSAYKDDIFNGDGLVVTNGGKKVRPARYYNDKLLIMDESEAEICRVKRLQLAKMLADDNTPERLDVKERIITHNRKNYRRSYENGHV